MAKSRKNSAIRMYMDTLMGFIRERLGDLAGKMLLDLHLKKLGIQSLDSLNETSIIKFSNYFIYEVFKRHLSRKNIDSLILQLNLQFCFAKVSESISSMLDTDIMVSPSPLKFESAESFLKSVDRLDSQKAAISIDLKGYVTGKFLLLLNRGAAERLSDLMLEKMLGNDVKSSSSFSEMKESAIKELFGIIISVFITTISNMFGKGLEYYFTERSVLDVKGNILDVKNMVMGKGNGGETANVILSSDFTMQFCDEEMKGDYFMLIESAGDAISAFFEESLVDSTTILKDFDVDSIELSSNLPTKESLIEVMEVFYPGKGKECVEAIMEKVNISGFTRLTTGIKLEFANRLLNDYFKGYTERVILFVKQVVGLILNVPLVEADRIFRQGGESRRVEDRKASQRMEFEGLD